MQPDPIKTILEQAQEQHMGMRKLLESNSEYLEAFDSMSEELRINRLLLVDFSRLFHEIIPMLSPSEQKRARQKYSRAFSRAGIKDVTKTAQK